MKKKIIRFFKLLNPKNLAAEVHVYGYDFSWKAHMAIICISLFGIGGIGYLFKLKPGYFSIVLAAVCGTLPIFILYMYKRMFEQKRFADVVTYAEQILYSFQKSGKIVTALRETKEVFEDGKMRWQIEDAIEYLDTGKAVSEKGILREALNIIENSYLCTKIHMIHELLISSEEYGGDVNNSIYLVLNDIELWKRRGYLLQNDKKKSHTDNIISIIVAAVLCLVTLYVLNEMGRLFPGSEGVNIFEVQVLQISSFVFILCMLYVFYKSMKSLTTNWLQSERISEEKYIMSSYDLVMEYDERKEKKKSYRYAIPFFLLGILFFRFKKQWGGIVCFILSIVLLMQHKIGYLIARKEVNKELYIALPQWLMEMALLLQNNNVQVSLEKSISAAPKVLNKELLLLMERLKKEPDKLSSYTDFCKNFDIPEVQSCMKMLHAISESGTGDAAIQMNNLIQRVYEMQNVADNIYNEHIAFQMRMIFLYPVTASTVKLLVDLAVGMFYVFQLLGNMGGI